MRKAHSVWWEPATGVPGFATETRLPTLFRYPRCSRTEKLDPSTYPQVLHPRARGAARRLSTSAIESIREHEQEHESPEPRAPCRWSPTYAALPAGGYAEPGKAASFRLLPTGAWPVESSRVRDRGPGAFAPHYLGIAHRDRSQRELCPNPIGPDTSCHKLVTLQAGVSCSVGPSFPRALVYEPARRTPLTRRSPPRAALHAAPRRDACSAAPEVPSIVG